MKDVAGDKFQPEDVTRKQAEIWSSLNEEKRKGFSSKVEEDMKRYEREIEANPKNKVLKTIFDNPADESKNFVPRRADGTIIEGPSKSSFQVRLELSRVECIGGDIMHDTNKHIMQHKKNSSSQSRYALK